MVFVYVCAMVACVVLFLPMVMAGYHLSRNKMLFFGAALFITLAVGVHLTPYFPSVSRFTSNVPNSSSLASEISCLAYVDHVRWQNRALYVPDSDGFDSSLRTWDWARSDPVLSCGFQKLGKKDVLDLLNGSWVLVAGDSQARLFVVALLGLVLDDEKMIGAERDLFKRHSDYRIEVEENGMRIDYLWAPYTENLTIAMSQLESESRRPDVLVMGSGLWHMLHLSNPTDYSNSLFSLKRSLVKNKLVGSKTHGYWLGMPTLVNSLLNTQEKQERMNSSTLEAYNLEVYRSKILHGSGGSLLLLDVEELSRDCGLECTSDGMHYTTVVYEAALQIMLNALLIESEQRI